MPGGNSADHAGEPLDEPAASLTARRSRRQLLNPQRESGPKSADGGCGSLAGSSVCCF
jgi:hypothetical protein